MKNFNLLVVMLVVFAVAQLQPVFGQSTADSARLEAEIGKVVRDYYVAYSRRDVATASAIWSDDGFSYSLESGYELNRVVKDQVSAFLRSPMASTAKDTYEVEDLKILTVNADMAMANYSLTTRNEQNGITDIRHDRTTNFLVRRDGRWQIIADHTSRIPNTVSPTASGMPVGWKRNSNNNYSMTIDTSTKHGGKASAVIKFTCGDEVGFGSLSQSIAADDYRGKRVRLSGWLRSESAKAAGLWMRLDGDRRLLGFDNMLNRPVTGTTGWKQYEIVLDVPLETISIFIGTLLDGKGQVWADDFKLEIVSNAVPVTNQLSPEEMRLDFPNRKPQKLDIKRPLNMGFEAGSYQ